MDERKTVPRSGTPGKIDVAKADQRRAKTAKITRRPNEYIPSDDSDVLGPSPEKLSEGQAFEQRLAMGQAARRDPLPVSVRTGTDRTLIYGAMVFACVVALAATIAFAIGQSRNTPSPPPSAPPAPSTPR